MIAQKVSISPTVVLMGYQSASVFYILSVLELSDPMSSALDKIRSGNVILKKVTPVSCI